MDSWIGGLVGCCGGGVLEYWFAPHYGTSMQSLNPQLATLKPAAMGQAYGELFHSWTQGW
jgi:hypothetical protein